MNTHASGQETVTDTALLAAISARDREAFGRLYDRHSGVLFATAIRILNNSTDAEDVLQETMLQIWERASAYRPEAGSPFAWIVTLLRNKAIERLRANKLRAQIPDKIRHLDGEAKCIPESNVAEHAEKTAIVKNAIDILPTEQRQAIEMAFFDVMTQQEISERIQQPLGTVKARIRRGMMKLRDYLNGRL